MKINEVFAKTRLYLADMQKSSYSDWEVFEGINDALRIVAETNAANAGPLLRRSEVLDTGGASGSAKLPEDFLREIKAFGADGSELLNVHNDEPTRGEFGVRGKYLFSCPGSGNTTLWYFACPPPVNESTDELALPSSMAAPVAKIARECVLGAMDRAVEAARLFYGGGEK